MNAILAAATALVYPVRVMVRPLLWVITLALPFIFFALLAYLLSNWIAPLDWSSLKIGDFANLIGLGIGLFAALVAIGSLLVTLAQFRQAIKDSEEQQKNLEASRQQLQAVVETLKQQQETLTRGLDTSRDLFALQKEQQSALNKSLETTKSLYQLQKEERERILEMASRSPKVQVVVGDQIAEHSIQVSQSVGKDANHTLIPIVIKNIGTATLRNPIITVEASNKLMGLQLAGAPHPAQPNAFRSRLGGAAILDLLPFGTSELESNSSITVGGLSLFQETGEVDINYLVTGDNLPRPFKLLIHLRFNKQE